MILKTEETNERLNSTKNLLNRLNLSVIKTAPVLKLQPEIQVQEPKIPAAAELVDNLDDKLALASVKRSAMRIAGKALQSLEQRIPEIESPKQLSTVARDMGQLINATEGADKKRVEAAQIVIWQPTIINSEQFNSVSVVE